MFALNHLLETVSQRYLLEEILWFECKAKRKMRNKCKARKQCGETISLAEKIRGNSLEVCKTYANMTCCDKRSTVERLAANKRDNLEEEA